MIIIMECYFIFGNNIIFFKEIVIKQISNLNNLPLIFTSLQSEMSKIKRKNTKFLPYIMLKSIQKSGSGCRFCFLLYIHYFGLVSGELFKKPNLRPDLISEFFISYYPAVLKN